MSRSQRGLNRRQRLVAGRLLLVGALAVYAYAAAAFKEYRIWTLLTFVVLLVVLAMAAWRFQWVRQLLWIASKSGAELIVKSLTPAERSREPVPESLKSKVRARAGNRCQRCGIRDLTVLEIHHINEKNNDNRYANLVLLCANDHAKAHRGGITARELRVLNRVGGIRHGKRHSKRQN